MIIDKVTDEIGRIGRLRKQNEDGVKSKKIENGIRKIGRSRRR
jgi:hypothetical protein